MGRERRGVDSRQSVVFGFSWETPSLPPKGFAIARKDLQPEARLAEVEEATCAPAEKAVV